MLAELALYVTLAALAALATWHDEDMRWIGLWLVVGCGVSNALFFAGTPPVVRTGPYSAIEIMVAAATFWALKGRSRWLIAILFFNLISIAANLALLINFPPTEQHVFAWNVTTNASFAAECLIAAAVGLYHGYRAGSFDRLLPRRWRDAAPGVARKSAEP